MARACPRAYLDAGDLQELGVVVGERLGGHVVRATEAVPRPAMESEAACMGSDVSRWTRPPGWCVRIPLACWAGGRARRLARSGPFGTDRSDSPRKAKGALARAAAPGRGSTTCSVPLSTPSKHRPHSAQHLRTWTFPPRQSSGAPAGARPRARPSRRPGPSRRRRRRRRRRRPTTRRGRRRRGPRRTLHASPQALAGTAAAPTPPCACGPRHHRRRRMPKLLAGCSTYTMALPPSLPPHAQQAARPSPEP